MIKKALFMCLIASNLHAAYPPKVTKGLVTVFTLLRNAHGSYIGEPVSKLQHALQVADLMARSGGSDEEVIAGLVHDIGHDIPGENMNGYGTKNHEALGAKFLREQGFSERVCNLVHGHIDAKRYLCATDPAYYAQLSDASKQTLRFQGDIMSTQEQAAFEQDPFFKAKIQLRRCDDLAKDPHAQVPSIEHYWRMTIEHLRAESIQQANTH